MPTFLTIQNTYLHLELALFQGTHLINLRRENKLHASKNFVLLLDEILKEKNRKISAIEFIAVNQGPGPFSTLRVVIASVNGISFATQTPLIGIDGLTAFLEEHASPTTDCTVALLNAFAQDVYFAIKIKNQEVQTGYKKIDALLDDLQQLHYSQIQLIGNGVALFEKKIKTVLQNTAIIPTPLPQTCSIEYIAKKGLEKWQKKEQLSQQLLPLYLKRHAVELQG